MKGRLKLWKNTTKEQRRRFVDGALAIGLIDSRDSEEDVQKIMDKYINGEKELEEVRSLIVELCRRKYVEKMMDETIDQNIDALKKLSEWYEVN